MMSDRGTHPDLIEEEASATPPAPAAEPSRGRRRRSAEPTPAPAAEADASEPSPPTDQAEAGPTQEQILEQIKGLNDPKEMLGLLTRFLPKDDLARDNVLAGYIGDRVHHGIQDRLAQQERERAERERQEAYQRGDLYALGQLSATDYAEREQALRHQAEVASSPYMAAIRRWQERLPAAVQQEVSGRQFAPNGTLEDGFMEYLEAVKEASIRHGFDEEVRKREPALRKALLSDTVGSEFTPEREGGTRPYTREITDEQVGAMSLEEYNEHFDEKGRARNGIQVRYTRAIDPRTQQR